MGYFSNVAEGRIKSISHFENERIHLNCIAIRTEIILVMEQDIISIY